MKKNYKLVVWISTEQKEKLERQAREEKISTAELCRRRLLIKENLISR